MTNREKFKEVFGFEPERSFPCPEKCPEEFENVDFCKGCPYHDFEEAEYKEPETKASDFSFESAEIMSNLASTLQKHSPIKSSELYALICIFMDVITNDHLDIDNDLAGVRSDLAEMFYKTWPHSVEYYRKEKA